MHSRTDTGSRLSAGTSLPLRSALPVQNRFSLPPDRSPKAALPLEPPSFFCMRSLQLGTLFAEGKSGVRAEGSSPGVFAYEPEPQGALTTGQPERRAARSRSKWSGSSRGRGEGTEPQAALTTGQPERRAARSRSKWSGSSRGRGEGTEPQGALTTGQPERRAARSRSKWSGSSRGRGEGTEPQGALTTGQPERRAARSPSKWSGSSRGRGEGTEPQGALTTGQPERRAARSRSKWSGSSRGRGEGTEPQGALTYDYHYLHAGKRKKEDQQGRGAMVRERGDASLKSLRVPIVIGLLALANFGFDVWASFESDSIRRQSNICHDSLLSADNLRYQLLSDEITSEQPNLILCRQIVQQSQLLLRKLRAFPTLERLRRTGEEAHVSFGRTNSSSAALALSSCLSRIRTELQQLEEQLSTNLDHLQLLRLASSSVQFVLVASLSALALTTIRREDETLLFVEEGLKSVSQGKSPTNKAGQINLAQSLAQLASTMNEIRRNEQAVINNALDVICTIDDANRFAMVNPSAARVLGYSPEELLGRRVQEFVADGKDDSIGMLVGTSKSMARVSMEMQWRRRDGTVVSLLWSAYWSSGSETLFCVVHDITDRKKAEQILKESESRLRAILQGMPVAVLVENNGLIEYANKHALTLSGYSAQELPGEMLSILSPMGSKSVQSYLDNKVEGAEVSLIRKNGEIFQAELYSSPLAPGSSEDSRRLIMFVDVTERHRMEQLKREFLAMAGHELRTPLTSIRVTMRSVADGVYGTLSQRGNDLLERCDGEMVRLVSLIGDMLDAERMRSGKLHLTRTVVPVTSIMDAAVAAVKPVAQQREIELVSKGEPSDTFADGAKLIQVLINLLSNAIKFSPSGSKITITSKALPDRVRVEVRDKGRGIPPGYEKVIFEQFSQVEQSDAKKARGAGLGLSICKSIIEAHGGVIGVDSEFGRGSVFWLELPCKEPEAVSKVDDDGEDDDDEEPNVVASSIRETEIPISQCQDDKSAENAEKIDAIRHAM
jgi:PAS domain S-box-containing protein